MFAPVVLGGGLLVVSLAGVGVQGRQVGAARAEAGMVSAAPRVRVSPSGPDVVYGRVVAKTVRAARVKRGQEAGGSREVVGSSQGESGRRGGGGKARLGEDGKARLTQEVRERPGRRGDREPAKRGGEEKERKGVECPPEEGERRTERAEEADRQYSLLSELGVRIVTTEGE